MPDRQFWIGVIAKDQAQLAARAGVARLNAGDMGPLKQMHAGDGFIFYSPRDHFPGGSPVQAFTGIGRVKTGQVYQVSGAQSQKPYHIEIDIYSAKETPIRPLIERLSFIEDKTHWGYPFRAGYLPIPEQDFRTIAEAMGVEFEKIFGI